MFGLQAPIYGEQEAYNRHRLHYCASCKLIAQRYGHASRLLLNYDLVFLGELLTALTKENTTNWEPNLQAVNQCFKLPQKKEHPFILEYIAAVHLFLAELKIQDQIDDQAAKYWSWAKSFYTPAFKKAATQLQKWGLDVEGCYHLATTQLEYEQRNVKDFDNLDAYLKYVARPTATITAKVLAHAAVQLNIELKALAKLGYVFGELTYWLDAYEDWEKDQKKGDFNPFLNWGLSRESAWNYVVRQKELVEKLLLELPLEEKLKVRFSVRLTSNILQKRKPSAHSTAWEIAQQKAKEWTCADSRKQPQLTYNIYAWAFFIQTESNDKKWWVLGVLGLFSALVFQLLPIHPKRKKERPPCRPPSNPCARRKEECRRAIIGMIIAAVFILLLVLGFMIWGVLLLVKGAVFWGLVLLLLFPLIVGIFFLIRAIKRAKMTKRERRRADRKVRRKKRLFKFLYKRVR